MVEKGRNVTSARGVLYLRGGIGRDCRVLGRFGRFCACLIALVWVWLPWWLFGALLRLFCMCKLLI